MKIVKENNKVIIFIFALTIIFFLLIIQINIFKNERLTINSEELRFILEFDKNKTNEETDQFIKIIIKEYFVGKDKDIIIKGLDYNLTKVSEGKVVELKEGDKTIHDESIKRFYKHDAETKKPINNIDIQDINDDDYFIGKAVLEGDIEVEFQYRVFDTEFPIIKSDDVFELPLNSEDKFQKKVSASDRVEGKLKVELEGSIDWNKEGTYDLVLKASDCNGNVSQKKVKLTLIDEKEETIANVDTDKETNSNAGNAGSKPQSQPQPQPEPEPEPKPQPQPKPQPNPRPKPNSNPVEDNSWKRHPKDFMGHDGVKMYFYKNYGSFEGCHAIADDLLDEMNWNGNWTSTFCDSNGDLHYSEY